MIHDIESIPYNIVEERAKYRESIYRERAVASERVRLAMGLSLRPEIRSVHLTDCLLYTSCHRIWSADHHPGYIHGGMP